MSLSNFFDEPPAFSLKGTVFCRRQKVRAPNLLLHILESCNAVFIGHSILVDLNAGKRCSVEAEFHALYQSVLGGLFDGEIAAAELVTEIDGRHLTADYGDAACFLRHM